MIIIQLLNLIGFVLSAYSVHVEKMVANNKTYKAMCDSEYGQCSRVLSSPYGKLVGFMFNLKKTHILNQSNGVYGVLFYSLMYFLEMYSGSDFINLIIIAMSTFSVMGSFVLAFILYYALKEACFVCFGIYFVNMMLLVISLGRVLC
jgi:uncharacterized membrane protein